MTTVTIGSTTFNLVAYSVSKISEGVINLKITDATIDGIENAVKNGDGSIVIPDEFTGSSFTSLSSISKLYDENVLMVTITKPSVDDYIAKAEVDYLTLCLAFNDVLDIVATQSSSSSSDPQTPSEEPEIVWGSGQGTTIEEYPPVVRYYYRQIVVEHNMTISNVPTRWRTRVSQAITLVE